MEGLGSESVDCGGSSAPGDPAPRLAHSGQLPGGGKDKAGVTLWVISKQSRVLEPGWFYAEKKEEKRVDDLVLETQGSSEVAVRN